MLESLVARPELELLQNADAQKSFILEMFPIITDVSGVSSRAKIYCISILNAVIIH